MSSETKHTPIPWHVGFSDGSGSGEGGEGFYICTAMELPVVSAASDSFGIRQGVLRKEDAEHIVRCVNEYDALKEQNAELLAACERIVAWLTRLAEKAEHSAKTERFLTLRDAYLFDARNYRATAADVQKAIAKAVTP